jgi:hypothetical protein
VVAFEELGRAGVVYSYEEGLVAESVGSWGVFILKCTLMAERLLYFDKKTRPSLDITVYCCSTVPPKKTMHLIEPSVIIAEECLNSTSDTPCACPKFHSATRR